MPALQSSLFFGLHPVLQSLLFLLVLTSCDLVLDSVEKVIGRSVEVEVYADVRKVISLVSRKFRCTVGCIVVCRYSDKMKVKVS